MEEFSDITKVSKYNSAADQIQRIGNLWKLCHKYASGNYFLIWNGLLDRIWVELAGDLDNNSIQEIEFLKLNREIENVGNLSNGEEEGFNHIYKEKPELTLKHKELLMKKEIFLRRLQNKLGKGTAWKDEFEDDFE